MPATGLRECPSVPFGQGARSLPGLLAQGVLGMPIVPVPSPSTVDVVHIAGEREKMYSAIAGVPPHGGHSPSRCRKHGLRGGAIDAHGS
jgi:hypothetical protein